MRELAPAGSEQAPRLLRVLEHAGLRLAKDAVARERAQEPVQRVRVAVELRHRPRPVRQRLRHPRVDDGRERLRHQRTAQKVPEPAGIRGRRRRGRDSRRPPRPSASGSRAGDGRRGRRRRPAARRRAAAPRATPRARTRSSAARRAAARRRRRARPSPRPRRRSLPRAARRARAPCRVCCASVRRTGIRSGASRWRSSVPSSAASESLSIRSARCSGCRRSRSTRSARPSTIPACGPPSSLSPEKQTRSAPAASDSRAVGSASTGAIAPEPRSSTSGRPWRRATAATSSSRGRSSKPTTRKFDWWTRSRTAVSGPIARS